MAAVAAVLLVCGYAVVHLAGRFAADPGPPTPPPGSDDPLNRVVLIRGGSFLRGSDDRAPGVDPSSPFSTGDERPRRRMRVAGFWMQEHEVTNEEYGRHDAGHEFPVGQERHPVVNVTWREALDYAASLGGSLPTEWQWEFAARGTESRRYPWGAEEPTCERAHHADCAPRGTVEVMSRPAGATPGGVHDLAGNVWEWVLPDWYVPGRTPVNGETPRMRGGSFADDAFFLRAANRSNGFFPWFVDESVGFRVVWPVER